MFANTYRDLCPNFAIAQDTSSISLRTYRCPGQDQMDETKIDRVAMSRLAKSLAFICGATHPATVAMQTAADSGTDKDAKAARAQFLKLKSGDRRAAMDMLAD